MEAITRQERCVTCSWLVEEYVVHPMGGVLCRDCWERRSVSLILSVDDIDAYLRTGVQRMDLEDAEVSIQLRRDIRALIPQVVREAERRRKLEEDIGAEVDA